MKYVSFQSFPASAQNTTVCNSMLVIMLRCAPYTATQKLGPRKNYLVFTPSVISRKTMGGKFGIASC